MLTVHVAGPRIEEGTQVRQRCVRCGNSLVEGFAGETPGAVPAWPEGSAVAVEGVASWVIAEEWVGLDDSGCTAVPLIDATPCLAGAADQPVPFATWSIHGSEYRPFVTADHRHGWRNETDWGWSAEPEPHFAECLTLFPEPVHWAGVDGDTLCCKKPRDQVTGTFTADRTRKWCHEA